MRTPDDGDPSGRESSARGSAAGLTFLGHGPRATGGVSGWAMSPDLRFRCVACGFLMSGDPATTESCPCGALHKDASAGRFGSRLGDDAIEVYRAEP